MIENLKGIFETVNFKENTNLRLYYNDEPENYPPHWHTPIEIIMPIHNIYTIECGGHTFILREKDIIIICPCCLHTLYAPQDGGERIIFQPDTSVLRGMKEIETILSILSPVIAITPEDYPDIHPAICSLLLEIKEEYMKNSVLSEAAIYSKVLAILVMIGRNYIKTEHFDVTNNKQQEYTEKFLYICDYISTHCTEDLTLDFVADLAGFSKYHFTRLFKQFTNVSFYKYLNQKRIATAEEMLVNPEYTITDVAIRSGFSSLSSFIRMFKIIKNCTPTEFRNMYTLL